MSLEKTEEATVKGLALVHGMRQKTKDYDAAIFGNWIDFGSKLELCL